MNSIFQSSNYTLGGAPCNPQDTSPCLSDEMGISHLCTQPAISGVQAGFNMEYLPEALPQHCLCIVQARLRFCWRSLMKYRSPRETISGALYFGHQRFYTPEPGDVNYYGCLLLIQECTGEKNSSLSKRKNLNCGGRIKRDRTRVTIGE